MPFVMGITMNFLKRNFRESKSPVFGKLQNIVREIGENLDK